MARRKRSDKLVGEDYRRYWENRAAETGPSYVGRPRMTNAQIRAQGKRFWGQLQRILPPSSPEIRVVTEFGCAWGRIANRLHGRYSPAEVWGIDMVLEAVEYGRRTFPHVKFFRAAFYHHEVPTADLLVTCTCLQHITDPEVFGRVVRSFRDKVRPGGYLVMFENATPGARHWHMHEMKPEDYINALPGFDFEDPIIVTDVDPDPHFLLRGRRAAASAD